LAVHHFDHDWQVDSSQTLHVASNKSLSHVPALLDLSSVERTVFSQLLLSARNIDDLGSIMYPDSIRCPKLDKWPAKGGKFMSVIFVIS